LALSACRFGSPRGSTTQGHHILHLYQLLFWVAIPVGVIVYGLILWSIVRYRRSKDPEGMPKQFRYHVPLEILYTVVPVVVVIGLFVATFHTERKVDHLAANPDVRVTVTAFQWQWRFHYPDLGIDVVGTPARNPTLVVPADRTVRIRLVSTDVAHAFYVPDTLFKRDALPGFPNRFDLKFLAPGIHRGECAEFCGLNHADMNFTVRVLSPKDFDAWTARARARTAS
jgi:cytochrome c oxidase subunit 2